MRTDETRKRVGLNDRCLMFQWRDIEVLAVQFGSEFETDKAEQYPSGSNRDAPEVLWSGSSSTSNEQ